jgi:hypothetical protein
MRSTNVCETADFVVKDFDAALFNKAEELVSYRSDEYVKFKKVKPSKQVKTASYFATTLSVAATSNV